MNDACMRYFRDQANVTVTTVGVTSSAQQALPADPQRYLITLFNHSTVDLTVYLNANASPATGTFHIPAGMGPVVVSEDVVGELIRLPMWVVSATAGPTNFTFYSCAYTAARYAEMNNYVKGVLAPYGAL